MIAMVSSLSGALSGVVYSLTFHAAALLSACLDGVPRGF